MHARSGDLQHVTLSLVCSRILARNLRCERASPPFSSHILPLHPATHAAARSRASGATNHRLLTLRRRTPRPTYNTPSTGGTGKLPHTAHAPWSAQRNEQVHKRAERAIQGISFREQTKCGRIAWRVWPFSLPVRDCLWRHNRSRRQPASRSHFSVVLTDIRKHKKWHSSTNDRAPTGFRALIWPS